MLRESTFSALAPGREAESTLARRLIMVSIPEEFADLVERAFTVVVPLSGAMMK
jgi:hypothetical protein